MEQTAANLFLKEKYFMIFQPPLINFNRMNELATDCKRKKQLLLGNQSNSFC